MCYNRFMGDKRAKQDPKNRKGICHNFLKPFLITFCLVTAAGIAGLAAYRWVTEPAQPAGNGQRQTPVAIVESSIVSGNEEPPAQPEEAETVSGKYGEILSDPEYMTANNIYTKDAASGEQVTIAFAGDILFDDRYAIMARVAQSGDITEGFAPDLIAEMKSADIMMLNNEFPYSDRGEPLAEKQFTFRAKPSTASYLQTLGVDIVSLANNHAYDYGEAALLDTMDTLDSAQIVFVGAGHDLAEARQPVCYIINDIKIAIVSATQIERLDNPDTKGATETSPGVFRCWNGDDLMETVREAKENSDFVIAYLHWGTENEDTIDWAQEKQAAEITQAGADLVIGDHSHCLQPVGTVNGVPVVYSLGNFWFSSKTIDTGMVKATLTGDGLKSLQFIACRQSGCRTELLQGEEKRRVLDYMRSISGGVQIDEDGYVTWR